MIEAIAAKDFKGLSFEQPLSQYTIFVGPNGAGKSSRVQALTLAIMGYLPSDQKKRAGDIFETHAFQGKPFSVGFKKTHENIPQTFGRTWEKDKAGAVAQKVFCNRKALKQAEVEKALYTLGEPRVFDLKAFVELSEQKKIDYIFDLYPPEDNLQEIDAEITRLAEQEKKLAADHKALLTAAERLAQEIASTPAPAGTLPEIKAEIQQKEQALTGAREALQQAEVAEAQRQTEERVKKEMEEQRQTEEKKQAAQPAPKTEEPLPLFRPDTPAPSPKSTEPIPITKPNPAQQSSPSEILQDLQRVLNTLKNAGCGACAAMIVVKSLLTKYRKQEAA